MINNSKSQTYHGSMMVWLFKPANMA